MDLAIQLVAGAIGGIVVGLLFKKFSMGTIGNSTVGLIGGVTGGIIGGQILSGVLGGDMPGNNAGGA